MKQHIDSIVADMNGDTAWKSANVIKYVARADKKNGLEDLKKAREYIDMLIADKETENSRRGRNWKRFIRVVKRLSR